MPCLSPATPPPHYFFKCQIFIKWKVKSLRVEVERLAKSPIYTLPPPLPNRCTTVITWHLTQISLWPLATLSLFTQVYKWVLATYCWGLLCDGLASHPVGSSNTLSCFMLQKPGQAPVHLGLLGLCATVPFTLSYITFINKKHWNAKLSAAITPVKEGEGASGGGGGGSQLPASHAFYSLSYGTFLHDSSQSVLYTRCQRFPSHAFIVQSADSNGCRPINR